MVAAAASAPTGALAACPLDCDNDGWTTTGAPGRPPDCDPSTAAVSPNQSEVVGDGVDQDCDGRDALARKMLTTSFGPLWPSTGYAFKSTDTVKVGNGGGLGGSVTRTPALWVPTGPLHVVVDLDALSGTDCRVDVTTQPAGGGMPVTFSWTPPANGTQVSPKLPVSAPSRTVSQVTLACLAGSTMTVDWLTLQNGTDILPPAGDLLVSWADMDAPGGGLTTAIVRAADAGTLYGGSDVGGVAIKEAGTEWRSINGTAPTALMSQPAAGIADVLYTSWSALFALTGRTYGTDLVGGLWTSPDGSGDVWSEIGDTVNDNIGGYAKYASCDAVGHGGGRLLLEGGVQNLLIANGDPDAFGVSLWDGATGTTPCSLPQTGVTLPSNQVVGALASGYSASNGLPWLLIGYRGRVGHEAVFLCEMPLDPTDLDGDGVLAEDGLTCTTGTATCQEIVEAQRFDVRDLEVDPLDPSVVYLADGGDDPDLADCEGSEGGIYRLVIDDVGGGLTATVSDDLTAGAFAWTAGTDDLDLTGLAMDPDGETLLAFMPVTHDKGYGYPRMYRIESALLAAEPLPADWLPIEETTNADRLARQYHIDGTLGGSLSGAWLEAETPAWPTPYPEYHALGNAYDGVFYDSGSSAEEEGAWPLAVATEFQIWSVTGADDLDPAWDPEDSTDWTFWPEPTTTHDAAWQMAVVNDLAQDADGTIWTAVADLGLFALPDGMPAAQLDCLWDTVNAGGTEVVVVPNYSEGAANAVWALFYDQGSNEIPQELGLFRTLTGGDDWEYVGAGIANGNGRWTADDNQPWCKDQDPSHVAQPLGGSSGFAFNGSGGASPAAESWGNPLALDAIDEMVALVGFNSYSYNDGANEVGGRVAYTIDEGAAWTTVPFNGDWAGTPTYADDDCVAYDFYGKLKGVSFVGKGDLSWATELDGTPGLTDPSEGSLDFFVASRNPTIGGANDGRCALARVTVDSTGTSWTWFDLSAGALACDVDEENLRGVAASPWSNEVFVWGFYEYSAGVHEGGVCAIDVDDATLASRVVNPATYQLAIGDVSPHPAVADLLAVAPLLDGDAWLECMEPGAGACPDAPYPMFAERTGSGWNVTVLGSAPPMTTATAVSWAPLDQARLLYGTEGGGAWRGEISW
jgi:hypothetical protein